MGFDSSKYVELPEWASVLINLYWVIRVQGRIEAKRRRYYRKVEKEKLRLAEMGVDQKKIAAACRYLSNFKNYKKLRQELDFIDRQLSLPFLPL